MLYNLLMNYLSVNIKVLRTKAKLTQTELANIIGVSTAYISNVEKEIDKEPGAFLLAALANYFGVPSLDLFKQDLRNRTDEERMLYRLSSLFSADEKKYIERIVKAIVEEQAERGDFNRAAIRRG